jgi:hypothetical protein
MVSGVESSGIFVRGRVTTDESQPAPAAVGMPDGMVVAGAKWFVQIKIKGKFSPEQNLSELCD